MFEVFYILGQSLDNVCNILHCTCHTSKTLWATAKATAMSTVDSRLDYCNGLVICTTVQWLFTSCARYSGVHCSTGSIVSWCH